MRVDLVLPNEGPDALEIVRDAPHYEAMGFTGLWFTDHIVYHKSFPSFYGAHWLELLSTLSFVAATTKKVRLGLGILVVPHRDAVLSAKMLATIDRLSGGRIDLGVGTGWVAAEFEAVGRGDMFAKRGAYTNEALDVFELCWTQPGELAFDGAFVKFSGIQFEPKPVQPRIPVWIGSSGIPDPKGAVLRRVARYADVWHPTGYEGQILAPADVLAGKAVIDEIAGRAIPWSIRLHDVRDWDMTRLIDVLGGYQRAGCLQVAVDLGQYPPAGLRDRAQELIEACRGAGIA